MSKKYILILLGGKNRKLNCLDLSKINFAHKKKHPPIPKFNCERNVIENNCKINSEI